MGLCGQECRLSLGGRVMARRRVTVNLGNGTPRNVTHHKFVRADPDSRSAVKKEKKRSGSLQARPKPRGSACPAESATKGVNKQTNDVSKRVALQKPRNETVTIISEVNKYMKYYRLYLKQQGCRSPGDTQTGFVVFQVVWLSKHGSVTT